LTDQLGLFDAKPPKAWRASALRNFHARHETAEEALAGEAKAQRQEDAILDFYRYYLIGRRGRRATPSQVHEAMLLREHPWPLTSIRRALTNLTKAGKLRHFPADRRPGPLGAMESTWGLA